MLCDQSCPTLCNPMDCSPPGSSVREMFQARILDWVAISYSKGSSRPRDRTHVSCDFCVGRWILYHQATWEAQFGSVTQLCPTFCDPTACSTPGLPVYHQLPEPTQTHVHRVGIAIQPSYPLSSPSPAFNLSQHQGLF